jgi:hypothetical protein
MWGTALVFAGSHWQLPMQTWQYGRPVDSDLNVDLQNMDQ